MQAKFPYILAVHTASWTPGTLVHDFLHFRLTQGQDVYIHRVDLDSHVGYMKSCTHAEGS